MVRLHERARALDALGSAKTLARRLGVSYQELVDLVQTSVSTPPGLADMSRIQLPSVLTASG